MPAQYCQIILIQRKLRIKWVQQIYKGENRISGERQVISLRSFRKKVK
jgi:hypothetical protein